MLTSSGLSLCASVTNTIPLFLVNIDECFSPVAFLTCNVDRPLCNDGLLHSFYLTILHIICCHLFENTQLNRSRIFLSLLFTGLFLIVFSVIRIYSVLCVCQGYSKDWSEQQYSSVFQLNERTSLSLSLFYGYPTTYIVFN